MPPAFRTASLPPRSRVCGVGSPYDVSYRGSHDFDARPPDLWGELARVDQFERWWPWMRAVRLEGSALEPGSRISFRVVPPVRFEMQIAVDVTASHEPDWIEGSVSGDLSGAARLELRPQRRGSVCSVARDVEIADPKIRRVIHFARPVLLWAQRWAVEIALHGFRSHLHRR